MITYRLHHLETQKKIADKKIDEFVESVFLDMFGDPVINLKGWKKDNLGSRCKILRGASPRLIKKFLNGTVPWIKISDGTKQDNLYINETKELIIGDGVKKSRFVKKVILFLLIVECL